MNRVEFMETLSRLLQDIPEEDRIDALKYYNDYFDDAGSENEQNVIEELESPEKVAMKIKADREDTEDGKEGGTEKTTEEAIGKVTGENAAYSGAREQHDRENTYQYYQEDTYGEEKDNKIENIVPGQEITKDPTITVAEDSEDAYIRAKIEFSNNLSPEQKADLLAGINVDPAVWFLGTDGYYYYNDVVGADTEVVLFNKVVIIQNLCSLTFKK